MELILFLILYKISTELFDRKTTFIWLISVYFCIIYPDAVVYLTSLIIFYAGYFLIGHEKRGGVPLKLVSMLNHPFLAVPNLISSVWVSNLWFILGILGISSFQFFVLRPIFLLNNTWDTGDYFLMLGRSLVLLYPIIVYKILKITGTSWQQSQKLQVYWENPEEYNSFLIENNVSYVVVPKDRRWLVRNGFEISNEKEMLNGFPIIYETPQYTIYNVSSVEYNDDFFKNGRYS